MANNRKDFRWAIRLRKRGLSLAAIARQAPYETSRQCIHAALKRRGVRGGKK